MPAPLLTAETVTDGFAPLGPALSPDGRWAAYATTAPSRSGPRPVSALWVAATDASRGMLAATSEYGASEAGLSGSVGWEGVGPHPHDAVSPASFTAHTSTPVLIAHGEEETSVPVSQAVYLHRALRHFGVEHELVVYPGAGHGADSRAHQIDLPERARSWLDRWLGAQS